MEPTDDAMLAEQIRYYDERAPVYEQLYLRQGPYALEDSTFAEGWRRETGALERFVQGLDATGSVLELACGNGLWTRFLAPRAVQLVAVDASPRMLQRNREWVDDDRVRYERADLFAWQHDEQFDLVFAGFFLSHVPPDRWQPFWRKVAGWLSRDGTLAFADDVWGPDRPRSSDRAPDGPEYAHVRTIHDARFTIVKRFFRPVELESAFAEAGLAARVETTGEHFLFGTARRAAAD
ncbi:MAG: class I SAM-dependent methyltransferase [Actinomycetota bacterium]